MFSPFHNSEVISKDRWDTRGCDRAMTDDQVMTDNMLAAEGVGESRASFLETDQMVYTNGTIGRIMPGTQDFTVQSGTMTTIKDAESFNSTYGIGLIENSELVKLRGRVSISTLDLIHGALDVAGNEYVLRSTDSLSQDEGNISVKRKARRYSRLELEALRFVDPDKQQQKWDEIYKGLETVTSQEYDEISTNNQDKTNRNYDKWQQPNKKGPSNFKREVHVEDNTNVADAMEMSGLLYGSNADEESWTAEGEEYEDDSDEEYASIQRPAFLVDGEPDFESGSPQDGLEYLRRVRWEAAQMPKVKVAKFDAAKWNSEQTSYMPNIPEIAKCPETLSPSKHWVNAFLADFSEFRKDFTEIEGSTNRAVPTDIDGNPGPHMGKNVPTVSTIADMDSVSRAATLRNRIKALEAASSLSRDNCLWIFALCAAVDTPFDSEMSSCIRCLLRKCSSLLAKKSEYDEEVAMLHILIVISGKYFGQSEN